MFIKDDFIKINQILNDYTKEYTLDIKTDRLYYLIFKANCTAWDITMVKGHPSVGSHFQNTFDDKIEYDPFDLLYFYRYLDNRKDLLIRDFESDDGSFCRLYIGSKFLLFRWDYVKVSSTSYMIYAESKEDVEPLLQGIVPYKKDKKYFNYIVSTTKGNFEVQQFEVKRNVDTSLDNYNDDLPYKEYLNFCNSEESGIALMSGVPGTGKTTLIKKLMHDSDKKFMLMEASMLANINSSSFISFLTEEKDSVFVIEDCEKLLVSRDQQYNGIIGTLLNLSDGILGDALKIKFICTFNTNINNVDKAILRKGRLKVRYEFKPLSKDKANKIGKSLGVHVDKDTTLAELYNQSKVNFSEENQTKLGF